MNLSFTSFSKTCLEALAKLQGDATIEDFGPLLDCLCAWGYGGEVLDHISLNLKQGLQDSSNLQPTLKKV